MAYELERDRIYVGWAYIKGVMEFKGRCPEVKPAGLVTKTADTNTGNIKWQVGNGTFIPE